MKDKINVKFIARTGIFAAISVILYLVPLFNFNLPFFPGFLKIHLDEIPALIAGFAYGPLSGFFIVLIKTLCKLPFTSTMCVGELADFIYSCAFIVPASLIYKKMHTFKGALISMGIAVVIQTLTAAFITTFLILDFYIFVMGFPEGALLKMCQAVNPNITDLRWSFFLYVGLPFNAFKDLLVAVATIAIYKKLHTLIDKIGVQKNQDNSENLE